MEAEILNGANIALVSLILLITGGIKFIFSEFFESVLGQRILPIIPIVLGIIGSVAGISQGISGSLSEKIVIGLLSGVSASALFKVGKTSVAGIGVKDKKVGGE